MIVNNIKFFYFLISKGGSRLKLFNINTLLLLLTNLLIKSYTLIIEVGKGALFRD